MHVNCPQCQAEIGIDDIDLGLRIGKCRACSQVVNIADQLTGISGPAASSVSGATSVSVAPEADTPIVPKPASLVVEDDGQTLVITKRWFHPAALFLVFFCVAWDSFLVVWYSFVLSAMNGGPGQGPPDAFRWLFIIFPIGHVAVGVGLTYFCVATFLNRTTLSIQDGFLSLRHGPMFWPGQFVLPVDDIEQFYVKSLARRMTYDSPGMATGMATVNISGQLMAVLKSGGERKVWGQELDPGVVRYLEHCLEEFLGIEDRRVAGELR